MNLYSYELVHPGTEAIAIGKDSKHAEEDDRQQGEETARTRKAPMPSGSSFAKRTYGITWFCESRRYIEAWSPVETKDCGLGSAGGWKPLPAGAAQTVVSSVLGRQFQSIVARFGSRQVLLWTRKLSRRSMAGLTKERFLGGGRALGSGCVGGAGLGPWQPLL